QRDRQRHRDRAEQQVVNVREAIHHEGRADEHGVAPCRRSTIDKQCREQQRQPCAEDHLDVRKLSESIRNEAVQQTGEDRWGKSMSDRARQDASAVRCKCESEEDGEVMNCERSEAECVKREANEGDAEEMLAVRESKCRWIKNRRVE